MAVRALQRKVSVSVGMAEKLPFSKKMFDGVLMILSLCFIEKQEEALLECRRVLREDGTIYRPGVSGLV